jgi:hypothetical protein
MLFDGFIPSGLLHGNGVSGRDWRTRHELGGNGPNCFSYFYSRVMIVKCVDWSVIAYFQEVLVVKCNTMTHN